MNRNSRMPALGRFGVVALLGVIFAGLFVTGIRASGSVEGATSTPIAGPTPENRAGGSVGGAPSAFNVSEKNGSGTSSTDCLGWWNSTWTRRRPITITGSHPENCQLRIVISYDPDMRSDYGDLRFIENKASGVLSY